MGWNDHVDWDLVEAIKQAVEDDQLEEGTPAYGIAQQVAHSGYDSLTVKQRYVYDKDVVPALSAVAKQQWINERMSNAGD